MYPDYTSKHEKRFWAKVDKSGGDDACWNWTAYRSKPYGYGTIGWRGSVRLAHRVVWELVYEVPPDELCVCHSCDNPSCVNPKHLFLGTKKDNADDRDRKGRNINYKGDKHGMHKLTQEQVNDIRTRYAKGGTSTYKLAKEFRISQCQAWRIVRNLNYRE